MTERVPFVDLVSQQAEIASEVLAEWGSQLETAAFIGGPVVAAFEREYAAYIGVEHVIGVSNGTDPLELAYRAVGFGPGDEVIMPVNTFVATAEAASRIGAVPVFVDVDPEHLLIDPDAVEAAITPRTRAIVPVHLFGQTAPMEALAPIAAAHGVPIVEDAAQAQGASSSAGRAGALGGIAATSFYPGKNLGAYGDAGGVMTDDPEVAARIRQIRNHGGTARYEHNLMGVNSRLDSLQAVVLSTKLAVLEVWNKERQDAADLYADLLAGTGPTLPEVTEGNEHVWHLYVVQSDDRRALQAALDRAGVAHGIHYPAPVHRVPAFAHLGRTKGEFPVTDRAAGRILSLPIFPGITPEQQELVAAAVKGA